MVLSGIVRLYAKYRGELLSSKGGSIHLKFHLPPYKAEIFFVTDPGTIYIDRTTVKFLTQEKKAFLKILRIAQVMAKKNMQNGPF